MAEQKVTLADLKALRERAKRDLFFLAKELLSYDQITEFTHRALADFFVQKDPDNTLGEQDKIKDRLLLYPRGAFKSTFNIADVVQWIICFPEIRVLILSGAADLADGFISEINGHFTVPDSGEKTLFQKLFPEHCIKKKDSFTGSFTTPARKKNWKEPTVMANSVESSLSGWHFDVVKGDDPVTNRNSETPAGRRKVARNLHTNRKMLMPHGYWELIGTRYAGDDAYADVIENAEEDKTSKVLQAAAMWLKPGIEAKKCAEWKAEEVELLFPENLSYEFLMKELKRDRPSFFLQYMNDPSEAHDVVFTMDDLRARIVPVNTIPREGDMYIAWDLAYGTAAGRDHTSGAVGQVTDGKLYVHDVVYGRFRPSEIGWKVVDAAKRWSAKRILIEDSPGARFLENDILNWQRRVSWSFSIEWVPITTTKDAKEIRVRGLEMVLSADKMFFSSAISCIDEVFRQLSQFGIIRQDDIPDSLAYLTRFLPNTRHDPGPSESNELKEAREREWYDIVYGLNESDAPVMEEDTGEVESNGLLGTLVPGLNC